MKEIIELSKEWDDESSGGSVQPSTLPGSGDHVLVDIPPDADALMRMLVEELRWDAGAIWLRSPDGGELRCGGFWGADELGSGDFAQATREMRFEPGLGLIGRVWESGEEEWIDDVTHLPDYVRIGPARRERIHSAYVLPLEGGTGYFGVLEFYARRRLRREEQDLDRVRRIAAALATVRDPGG